MHFHIQPAINRLTSRLEQRLKLRLAKPGTCKKCCVISPNPISLIPIGYGDYFIAALTFICVALSLNIDASGSVEQQNFMGIIAWTFLLALLFGENKEVRMQVIVAVAFATAG